MVHGQKEAGSGTPSQRETRSVMDLDPDTQIGTEGGAMHCKSRIKMSAHSGDYKLQTRNNCIYR